MKILAVNHIYYLPVSGINRVVKRVGEELVKRGHEYTVLTLHSGSSIEEASEHGIHVIKLPCKFFKSKWYAHLSALRFLLANVADFDVVNSHNYYSFWSVFAAWSCKKRGVPFVFTPHYHGRRGTKKGWYPLLYDLFSPFGRLSFSWARATICVSQYERALITRAIDASYGRSLVIQNGVDTVSATGAPHRIHNPASILCVTNLFESKGVQYLIEAMRILHEERQEDVTLNIVGDGPFKPRLEALVKKYSLTNKVLFRSHLSRTELDQQYKEADVFALLSYSEAYGIVVAEALAAGIPCIVAKAAALEEFTNERGCFGIEYPPDIPRLTSLISKLLHNNVPVGPLNAQKIRTWDKVAEEYEHIYYQVAATGPQP